MNLKKTRPGLLLLIMFISTTTFSQETKQHRFVKGGDWYFAWGYGKYWYPKTDIHISQDFTEAGSRSTHTEYTLIDVAAHDRLGLKKLYNVPITVPQFSCRLGYFFNEKQDLGLELTYDHAKFITSGDQYVEMKGTTAGVPFDSLAYLYTDFSQGSQPFIFKLNNGANFFELNLVKRFALYDSPSGNIHFSYIAKAGAGWNTPHVENTVFGRVNDPHFQLVGGWNVGAESALRCVFFNRAYLEFGQKGVYASYYHLRIAYGEAKLHFGAYEVVMTLGVNFPSHIKKELTTNS